MLQTSRFISAHATHPQGVMAAGLVLAQLKAQLDPSADRDWPNVALVYATDHFAPQAQAVLDQLRQGLPRVKHWCGTVGVGVCASGVAYFNEPGLVVMLCQWPEQQFQVFSGLSPLGQYAAPGFQAHTALVHADPMTPMLSELIHDVANLTRTQQLFGGLCASRHGSVQFAINGFDERVQAMASDGVFEGGLSGLAFGPQVPFVSRVTQGSQPVGRLHTITRARGHIVEELDGLPALGVLLDELKISLDQPQLAVAKVRQTLVGLGQATPRSGELQSLFGEEIEVRHIIGLDPGKEAVAIADEVNVGMRLSFCQRNEDAARKDLRRMAAEVREALETSGSAQIRGAVYVSCSGRGGPSPDAASQEMQALQQALGDVPLAGFYAAGEIAHNRIHGYTGVLTVFTPGVD